MNENDKYHLRMGDRLNERPWAQGVELPVAALTDEQLLAQMAFEFWPYRNLNSFYGDIARQLLQRFPDAVPPEERDP